MNSDEHDELWKLLGKAREPKISPFFSRNVLRAIREEQQEPKATWLDWLQLRWRSVSFATVTAAVAVVMTISFGPHQGGNVQLVGNSDNVDQDAREVVASPVFPVIENLDSLLAWEDNDVWLDGSVQ